MPEGRPTKYYPEICQELIDWFDQEPYEDIEIPHYKNGEVSWNDKKRVPRQLPTLRNFARSKKICISTIYNWIDEKHDSFHPEFLEAYSKCVKSGQKEFLIQNGLAGCWNPLFTKFVAVNMTDLTDKQEIDHTSKGEKIQDSDETLRRLAFILRAKTEENGK